MKKLFTALAASFVFFWCPVLQAGGTGMTIQSFSGSRVVGHLDGPAMESKFENIQDMAIAADGRLFVADAYWIRLVSTNGHVSTLAGIGVNGLSDGEGLSSAVHPRSVAVTPSGTVYFLQLITSNMNTALRKVERGFVSTVAVFKVGNKPGKFGEAEMWWNTAVAAHGEDILFITDYDNNVLRRVDLVSSTVENFAGGATQQGGLVDGRGEFAAFDGPRSPSIMRNGTILIAQSTSADAQQDHPYGIRVVSQDRMVTTIPVQTTGPFTSTPDGVIWYYAERWARNGISRGVRAISPDGADYPVAGGGIYIRDDTAIPATSFALSYVPAMVSHEDYVLIAQQTSVHKVTIPKLGAPPPKVVASIKVGVEVSGVAGFSYDIQASDTPDFLSPETVSTVQMPSSGKTWIDTGVANSRRFYRAVAR